MIRFFAIFTLQRGIIDPPEQLDAADQRQANIAIYTEQEVYRSVRYERDPPLTEEQRWIEELGRRTAPKQNRSKRA